MELGLVFATISPPDRWPVARKRLGGMIVVKIDLMYKFGEFGLDCVTDACYRLLHDGPLACVTAGTCVA